MDCGLECLEHPVCVSYNYQENSTTNNHVCELNDKIYEQCSNSLQPRQDFSYTSSQLKALEWPVPSDVCVIACHKSSACLLSHKDESECVCSDWHKGEGCQEWTDDAADFSVKFIPRSAENFLKVDDAIKAPVTALTACLMVLFASNHGQNVFSYSVASSNSEINFKYKNSTCYLTIGGTTSSMYAIPINDEIWHHLCVTWSKTAGDWELFVDGIKRSNGSSLSSGHTIGAGGSLVLGQAQKSTALEIDDLYRGYVTELNIWDNIFSAQKIASLSKGPSCKVTEHGNLLDWRRFREATFHGIVTTLSPTRCEVKSQFTAHLPTQDASSLIRVPNAITDPLSSITIGFWSQMSSNNHLNPGSPFAYTDASGLSAVFRWKFSNSFNNKFVLNDISRITNGPRAFDGAWHHYAITWQSSGGHLIVYVDGVDHQRVSGYVSNYIIPSGGQLILGQKTNGADSFIGNITGLNIWSGALHGLAISALSKGAGAEEGLALSWAKITKEPTQGGMELVERGDITSEARSADFYLDFGTVQSTANYGKFTGAIPDLTAFTACVWIRFKPVSSGGSGGIFQYVIPSDAEHLALYLYTEQVGYAIASQGWRYYSVAPVYIQGWLWVCWTWSSADGLVEYYIDANKRHSLTGYAQGRTITGQGTLILGQEVDAGLSFETSQAFTGSMSHLNIWSLQFGQDTIDGMRRGCGSVYAGDVLSWSSLRKPPWEFKGSVKIVERSSCTLPTIIVQDLRKKWCITNFPTCSSRVVLFDRNANYLLRKLRCYCITSGLTQRNGIYVYSSGASYSTRDDQLRCIHD